jgi:hypothetical protein
MWSADRLQARDDQTASCPSPSFHLAKLKSESDIFARLVSSDSVSDLQLALKDVVLRTRLSEEARLIEFEAI